MSSYSSPLRPFITLPVSETYLRLRSEQSSLNTFKIHNPRGLTWFFITMKSLIFYVRIADRRFFLLYFALSEYKYTRRLTRRKTWMFILDGHKSNPITSHTQRMERKRCSHICIIPGSLFRFYTSVVWSCTISEVKYSSLYIFCYFNQMNILQLSS